MSAKSTPGGGMGDFRPEELLGQLKAEQLSRNYDMAVRFIDAVLGLQLEACSLREDLRDGVVLCRLINALRPGAVKRINTKGLPFTQMENISNFLAAAQSLGLASSDLFQTVDLYEGKNMSRVVMTLLTIARVVAGIPLNSHRKLADAQRSPGDGWGSVTLAPRNCDARCVAGPEPVSVRIDPTLVGAVDLDAGSASAPPGDRAPRKSRSPPPLPPVSPHGRSLGSSSRRERRRSKRRSAVTLFAADKGRSLASPPPRPAAAAASAATSPSASAAASPPGTPLGSPADPVATLRAHSPAAADALREPLPSPPPPPPRPRKRTAKSRPRECLTVYSESAQRLTNYQLGNCIGRGQFGSVYRALDLETGEMVAVKQISLEGQDADSMEDVMQEVELLKSLSSPRIVRYYGFVKTDTHLSLVMEYVENGSLSATLKSFGAFPEKLVLAYAVKIIEGLICLHRNDVVHCDLKACNILTTKNGNTKLTDFGVSLNLKLRKPGDESAVAGTPYWMAPEIIQLEGARTASDIWSLGCTVIELLTGKPPYADLMQMAALYRIVEDDHPPIPDGISAELRDFLLRCFQKSPGDRPAAQALLDHPWTAQYRRNRKEMKLLRRTCSRKMSSFIARKQPACDYPTFNPVQLKPPAPAPPAEVAVSRAASWEEEAPGRGAEPEPGSEVEPELEPEPNLAPELLTAAAAAAASGDDTDTSISTFEGPRLKRHRLRTILCDANSVCVVCAKTLSGAFLQCVSCKTRCHDACVRLLQPCTAMRMSRFLYPASRKSSKRYESKSPNIRLRASRRSAVRRQHGRTGVPAAGPAAEMSAAELLSSVYSSHAGGLLGSSDGSLNLAALAGPATDLRRATLHDGFDGVLDAGTLPGQPAAPAAHLHSDSSLGRRWAGRHDHGAADSGWETDDGAAALTGGGRPVLASINIPQPQRRHGPVSAPLAAGSVPVGGSSSGWHGSGGTGSTRRQPAGFVPLAGAAGGAQPAVRPKSIRRMRANTASLEHLSGAAHIGGDGDGGSAGRGGISTLFRRRQHPLRGATSSDIRAVAGFSAGAARRARLAHDGSDASIGDLRSCTTSELLYSGSDLGLAGRASAQCFAVAGRQGDRRPHARHLSRDCVIM